MSEYTVSEIKKTDTRMLKKMDALLEKEGIMRDANLDFSLGIFDDDMNLIATGSCFKNTLRCMAVDSFHQGEGLLNQVVSELIAHEFCAGYTDLFLYTKINSAKFFKDLGFYELARVEDKLVFMENKKSGFENYIKTLKDETLCADVKAPAVSGAVVINANPITLGHMNLIKEAAKDVDLLHLFMVSEDSSLVPFDVREKLIKEATADISNIVYHKTGSYIISAATFPSYFLKDSDLVISSHAMLDVAIFAKIAAELNITRRYAGSEPFSAVTGSYNRIMSEMLPQNGIEFTEILRFEVDGKAVSASDVRNIIKNGNPADIKPLVPAATYNYFTSEAASFVIERIKACGDVIHY